MYIYLCLGLLFSKMIIPVQKEEKDIFFMKLQRETLEDLKGQTVCVDMHCTFVFIYTFCFI